MRTHIPATRLQSLSIPFKSKCIVFYSQIPFSLSNLSFSKKFSSQTWDLKQKFSNSVDFKKFKQSGSFLQSPSHFNLRNRFFQSTSLLYNNSLNHSKFGERFTSISKDNLVFDNKVFHFKNLQPLIFFKKK